VDSNPRSPVRTLARDVGTPTIIDGMRPRKSGSQRTRRWREKDSNPRSPAIGTMVFAHTMRPQPSVPRLYGALGSARRDPRRHREAQNARSFAATSSASDLRGTPGAPSWTKLELEIGFADFEHLAASPFAFSATFEICRDDRIVGRANAHIADESGIP
jgi:hypothetical protein